MTQAAGGCTLSDRVASGLLFARTGGGRSWGCWLGCPHVCTGAALGTSPGHTASFKEKLKESEKSKFEPGLPGHHESILVRAEREKTLYLIVYLVNGL